MDFRSTSFVQNRSFARELILKLEPEPAPRTSGPFKKGAQVCRVLVRSLFTPHRCQYIVREGYYVLFSVFCCVAPIS